MIEAGFAHRVGFSQSFAAGDEDAVGLALLRLGALGVGELRVPMSASRLADPAGAAWAAGLLARLSAALRVTLSVDIGHVDAIPAWLHGCLDILHGAGGSVEIDATGPALRDIGEAIRQAGCRAVLAVPASAAGESWLRELAPTGALLAFDAIGLHCEPARSGGRVGACDQVGRLRDAAHVANPGLAIWITRTGHAGGAHDLGRQAQAFMDAVAAPADRIFWSTLFDQPGPCRDTPDGGTADAEHGIFDSGGNPKLLARLLEGGMAELDRVLTATRRLKLPAITATRPVLVTGGAGFIGANLADRLAADGHHVHVYDALARSGVERNLHWLARRHPNRISFALADLRDEAALADAASRAEAVFHLAGQVAVTTSMVQPLADFEVNARGTLALLEALRQHNPAAPLVFASTNKVYGDLADIDLVRDGESYLPSRQDLRAHGVSETRPLCFHTPYGCSKGTADQYVLDYAHSFGLRTAVLRMSCIYGERQLGTEDQGWVAHFLLKAIANEGLTIYGDGRQVRDILHVGDAVSAYLSAWSRIDAVAGRAYNLGGGPANAISLLQLIAHIEDLLGRRVDVTFADWRPGDQRYFVADTTAARRDLGLPPALNWRDGVARLAAHFGAVTPETAEAAQ